MSEQQNTPAADPGNLFLSEGPSGLSSTVISTPAGQRLMLTIRTPSTTLTVFLQKPMGEEWVKVIQNGLDQMSSLMVAPANVQLPNMNGRSHG